MGCMLVHRRVTPQLIKFACTQLYTWMDRGTESVKCHAQDQNTTQCPRPGARFSKDLRTFRARKAIAKSRTLRSHGCFIHMFLTRTEVPFIQEVSGVYTSPFLGADELKMALRARKVSGTFEKQVPRLEPGPL